MLFFGDRVYGQAHDKILPTKDFREWFGGLRGEISQRELEYERQLQVEMTQREPDRGPGRQRQLDIEME